MNDIGIGLIVAAALYGFRHGFDLDHLAAIGDVTAASDDRKGALKLAFLYVAGHAFVVVALGVVGVVTGAHLPIGFDNAMGRVIGVTLIGLGAYLVWTALRERDAVRLRSRWMLAADGVRALSKTMKRPREVVVIEHSHEHSHDGTHDHRHPNVAAVVPGGGAAVRVATHTHVHTHVATMPADPLAGYSNRAVLGIGMVHGVGAETPTQILLFASAAGAGSLVGGTAVLLSFVTGLVVANGIVAYAAAHGLSRRSQWPRVYLTVAVMTGMFSLALGIAYVIGRGDALPALFGLTP